MIPVKLTFRPMLAVQFQASELIISSAQATNQFWDKLVNCIASNNYFKNNKYNVIKVILALSLLS